MQKETVRALAGITLKRAVELNGKSSVDRTYLDEVLASELPGLDHVLSEEILDMCMKLLPYVEVHVEVAFWRLDDEERQAEYDAQPEAPGSVW
jgi:hypothetical protein